ncbi:lipopolysaccharide heptosyltransferase I [Geomesophilobacter sediminis]|uniref:Lipopolysaccharide heptosyltransferase 1 n=1 Tax=Geomesophilobacter sediminis TaxID=2798584 RepID=A0A8J7IQ74_9BACT|nr:lipopolysaccharide heptosyltransferase I [Geomesophilobacter sediminis]MBJ6725943.1 lipopolysaccharide heptosyltransferase I [Geomesophilobacter sediminis]
MRVLIVKTSSLGDVIHALPLLDYLKQAVPGVEIDWVVEEPFRMILEGNPHLSRLFTVRTKAWRKSPLAAETRREVAELKEALRARDYDMVFDVQGNFKSGLIGWLTGCAERIGFDRETVREPLNLLFTTRRVPMRKLDYHVTEKYLRVVSVPFGKDFRTMQLVSEIVTSPQEDANAAALMATLSDGLVFLFHCGTSWRTKLWAQTRWVELGREILDTFREASILLTWGDQAERDRATEIAREIGPGARVIDRYPLKALTAILKKVDLVVAGDTGPVHIAAAVGTPTVSIFRATDGKLTGPRGELHVAVQSPLHCAKCGRKECDKDRQCSESVKVEPVLAAVKKLLGQ